MVDMIPKDHTVAFLATLMAGTTSSSVSDLQVLNDGNIYTIVEVGGTPGFNLELEFRNVFRFSRLAQKSYYEPGTHYIEFQLWNYQTSSWDVYGTIQNIGSMDYRFIDILNDAPYIKDSIVKIAFDHIPGGNAAHRMYIEYVALVR